MKSISPNKLAAWGRIFTAVPLGYIATSLMVMALARLLPGGPMQASVAAGLLSFLIYAALVIYIFAAETARQAFLATLFIGAVGAGVFALSVTLEGWL